MTDTEISDSLWSRLKRGRYSRTLPFSTQVSILLLLLFGLAPLGILGVTAALRSNSNAERDRTELIGAAALQMARNLETEIATDRSVVRRSLMNVPLDTLFPETARRICADLTFGLSGDEQSIPNIYIIGPDGQRSLCEVAISDPLDAVMLPGGLVEGLPRIDGEAGTLISSIRFAEQTPPYSAVIVYDREELDAILRPGLALPAHEVILSRGEEILPLHDSASLLPPGTLIEARERVGRSPVALTVRASKVSFTRSQLFAILAPLITWLTAAVIVWAMLGTLITGPLRRLHQSVALYQPGAVFMRPLARRWTAQEIVQLEEDFSAVSETVAADKAELAKGLSRQTSLTREVHHRVKNNLQIIASLVNLHSRSAPTPEAEFAYRSIQRRVDALAVVHRNHYAEAEDNTGIALRPLVTELAGSLRASAQDSGHGCPIAVAVSPISVSQDIGVPIAFLVTEIAELAMGCAPDAAIEIRIAMMKDSETKAKLTISSEGLAESKCVAHSLSSRYGRVLEGLSRQLRETLDFDREQGSIAIEFPALALG